VEGEGEGEGRGGEGEGEERGRRVWRDCVKEDCYRRSGDV